MEHLKKFNELFDTEYLKTKNEIDYLSGNFKNLGQVIDDDFKSESIGKLIRVLSKYHFPFLNAFIDKPEFKKFEILSCFDKSDDFWQLITKSDKYSAVLGLKINKVNDYDVYVYLYDNEAKKVKNPENEYDGLVHKELSDLIRSIYIPILIDGGFSELLDYNIDDLSINN